MASHEAEMANVSVRDIDFGERARQAYKDLPLLAKDIQERGLIHPIAIHQNPEGSPKPYTLLAGGRRFAACVSLNWPTIPCRIYPTGELDELARREIELYENISRENLDWREEVKLKQQIHDLQVLKYGQASGPSAGWSATKTAELLGVSKMQISRDRALASALETHGDELSKAKNKSQAAIILKRIERVAQDQDAAKRVDSILTDARKEDQEKRRLINGYILQDFFEGVQEVPDAAVNFIEVDPPYGKGELEIKASEHTHDLDKFIEVNPEDYPGFLLKVFTECYRVCCATGWMLVWYPPEWHEIFLNCLRQAKWIPVLWPGIWIKNWGLSGDRLRNMLRSYEPFFYAYKHPELALLRTPGHTSTFILDSRYAGRVHPTEHPIELYTEILPIFAAPNANIMVPFLGSGNTLLAGANLGMTGFGFDLTDDYKASFTRRVLEGTYGKYVSMSPQPDVIGLPSA